MCTIDERRTAVHALHHVGKQPIEIFKTLQGLSITRMSVYRTIHDTEKLVVQLISRVVVVHKTFAGCKEFMLYVKEFDEILYANKK